MHQRNGNKAIMWSDQDCGKQYRNSLALMLVSIVSSGALKEGFVPLQDFTNLLNIIDMLVLWLSAPLLLDGVRLVMPCVDSH